MSVALSVVVPVKDEAANVGPLAREIAAALAPEAPHEIIFIDDGSTDGTGDALAGLKSEIPALRVLRHERNLGQSRGIRSGVQAAKGDIIVTLDGGRAGAGGWNRRRGGVRKIVHRQSRSGSAIRRRRES